MPSGNRWQGSHRRRGEIPTTPQASTACNTVGRMGDEATRRLTVVLGTEASEVLRAAANSRNREVDLAERRWTAAGCTGARLAAVVERSRPPAPQRPRTYVVKVCPADGRRREGARHHAALEMSPADFAARHPVSMEGDPIGLPGGGELLLQNIAGASLARCRSMSEFAPADRALTAGAVARALTQDWTEETTWHLDELTVSGFLWDGLAATSATAGTDLADAARSTPAPGSSNMPDARVIGATVVAASPPVVVTGHSADDACGPKVWNRGTGGQSGAVVHRSRAHDAFVGPPRVGRTADGRPFVVHAVEDGVELLRLDRTSHDTAPVRLLLPFTVNDVTVQGDMVYLAGGGGWLMLTVSCPPAEADLPVSSRGDDDS